jgi:hypothetical protein
MIRPSSYPKAHAKVFSVVTLMLLMAVAPSAVWSQSSWPSYPNNNSITVTSSGTVGIGTAGPQSLLHISSATIDPAATIEGGGGNYNWPRLVIKSDISQWELSTAASTTGRAGKFYLYDHTHATTPLLVDTNGNVGIGTLSPQHLLHVAGTIGAQEVLVSSTGADYVFEPGYRLQPLSEVARFIEDNRHLPGIPSADEVTKNGMGVGEMEAKLLAKVEELTLHLIQQEKQNQELRDRIARLEAQGAH